MMRFRKNDRERNMTEAEKSLLKTEAQLHKLDKIHFFPRSPLILAAILFFIYTDYMFIFQLTDLYFCQAEVLGIICAITIAAVIDLIPSIIASVVNVKHKEKKHYLLIVGLTTILMLVFIGLFAVRWNSSDFIYDTSGTQLSVFSSETELVPAEENTTGQRAMTILFGLIPMATSMLSFCVSVLDDGREDKGYQKRISVMKCKSELANLEANNLEIQNELKRDYIGRNEILRALEHDDVEQEKIIAKEIIKFQMALAEGTPQGLSNVMEKRTVV